MSLAHIRTKHLSNRVPVFALLEDGVILYLLLHLLKTAMPGIGQILQIGGMDR